VVVFGGETAFEGDVYGDTWVYDANTSGWIEMTPSGSPPARTDVVMWYDPGVDLVFLFGGSADASEPSLPWRLFGGEELWAYDYEANSWTLFRVDPNPDYRDGADVAFDTQSGVAVFIGGSRYDPERRFQGFGNDVWTYRHDEGTG
jgi:hypothetical protein